MPVKSLPARVRISSSSPKEYLQKSKKNFENVDRIASSVDWKITYAFHKPRPPTKEERLWFGGEIMKLRGELEKIKHSFPFVDYQTLHTLEARISQMEEEFEKYPFSDRVFFFSQRIKFLRKLLRDIVYCSHEQGS